jgi:hypothetical protein
MARQYGIRNEMLLATPWVHLGNLMGTFGELDGNTLGTTTK